MLWYIACICPNRTLLGVSDLTRWILLFFSTAVMAAPESPTETFAYELAAKPVLDGNVVDDPAWQHLPSTTGFWQVRPNAGMPATQKTEVYVGFTDNVLYIAAICHDDSAQGILVTESRRDADLDDTDSFQVILDTFLDRQNGLVFATNPAGIEYDGQVTGGGTQSFGAGAGGFNLNWDTDWEVRTRVTEAGWSLEMAIPFRSLRYGGETEQSWGINFQRNIRRNNEIVYWAPLGQQYNLHRVADAGVIHGIRPPAPRNLKLTPYGLAKRSRGGGLGSDTDFEFGFDIKYSLTPGLTLDATYNTDFAQVEADEIQVNLDRFSIFLPEQRPFFLENADQFSVGVSRQVELFFSRRIGISPGGAPIPIDGGLRVSGKLGDSTNVGFLQMRSEKVDGIAPRNDYTVARVNQEFANRSSLGAIFVNREGDGSLTGNKADDYNRTYGVDGHLGIGDYGELSGFVAKTRTPGLNGKDHAFRLRGDYNSADWTSRIHYTEVGADFNPEVGFLSRREYRQLEIFTLRRYRPDFGNLHEIRPHLLWRRFENFDGVHVTSFGHADIHWEWKSGFEVHTGYNVMHETVLTPFEIVSGVTVPAGSYDDGEVALALFTDRSAPLSLQVSSKIGGLFGGDRLELEPVLRYRVGETFSSELSWVHDDIDLGVGKAFQVDVGRLRLSYSFTPRILLQALVQYDKRAELVATNLRFAWLFSGDTGLYVVYNEVDEDSPMAPAEPRREFIIKYSHRFDLLQ